MIFIDGGANNGDSTRYWLKYHSESDHICFEPFEYPELEGLNVRHVALSDHNGTEMFSGMGNEADTIESVNSNFQEGYEVECIDLSEFIAGIDDYIVLKLDIEGSEYKVLDKMIKDGTIDKVNELFVEFHPFCMPKEYNNIGRELTEKYNIKDWHKRWSKFMKYGPPWIDITTANPCKNGCEYCPQKVLEEAYKGDKVLSLDNFKKYLKNIPKEVNIFFSGFCEPFQNPQCVEMILHAHKEGYHIGVWTTLIGLTDEGAEKIKDIPFVYFHVHDIGQEIKNYPFIDLIEEAKPNSRAGNMWEVERKETVNGCAHSEDFSTNVMMPDGNVYICCQDWALTNKLGNLIETNLKDMKKDSHYELCHYCAYAK